MENVNVLKNLKAVRFVGAEDHENTSEIQEELGLDPLRISFEDNDNPVIKIETSRGLISIKEGSWIVKTEDGDYFEWKR